MPTYWRDDPDAPFATLLQMMDTYCHPEAGPDAYDNLVAQARRPALSERMTRFKDELRRSLLGDKPPKGAIGAASQYNDFSSEDEFLESLWRDLFPNEPLPVPSA